MSQDITKVDQNFQVKAKLDDVEVEFRSCESEPFRIYGVFREGDRFRRMPEAVAKTVSEGVQMLHDHTAGGRVRFVTDSPFLAIRATLCNATRTMSHFALTGACGFDCYGAEGDLPPRYFGTFIPPFEMGDTYENIVRFPERKTRTITINFPLYSGVSELLIGIAPGALLERAPDYRVELPVVFYGSSITQGGCASKPGSTYQSILSCARDFNFVNLGFSGSGKGEEAIVRYIAGLPMSAFVLDYDYNAPDVEHLRRTHAPFYQAVRSAHPDIPILMLSRPKFTWTEDEINRVAVIRETYEAARAAGDENVWFVDGKALAALVEDNGTVDNCHPTDSGFWSMAQALLPIFEKF